MTITARGIGVLVAGALLLVAGGALGYPELAAVGATGVIAVGFSLAAGLVPPRLDVRRSVDPDRVMRGDPCAVTLHIRNERPWGALTVVGEDFCGQRAVPIPLVRLRPGVATQVSYPVPTGRRGVVSLGPLRVGRRDPFGLARVQRTFGGTGHVWVYPKLHPMAAVPAGSARNLDGQAEKVPHGSITFDALREYVMGDDLRHVHWRTSARMGELMVKERVDTSRPRITVLIDDRAAVHRDDSFEDVCEAAASITAAAVREELAVQLVTASGVSTTVTGGSLLYLDLLAEARLHSDEELGMAGLSGVTEQVRARSAGDTLVCLTGRMDAGDLGMLMSLRSGYPTILAALFGPQEQQMSDIGMRVLVARDAAEFARMWDEVWAHS
jgi:uncharacterized protein (DUF58 family)